MLWGGHTLDEFADRPHIIGIIDGFITNSDLRSLSDLRVRLLELRADAFEISQIKSSLRHFAIEARAQDFGLLGTLRTIPASRTPSSSAPSSEQSYQAWPLQQFIYEQLLEYVDVIDIEYENGHRLSLFELAQSHKRLTLLSTHNFQEVPPLSELEAVLAEGLRLKADIIKFAYYARDIADLWRMEDWMRECSFPQLIWNAMGPWGMISRIMAPFLGSRFCYGFISKANAPGQLSVSELHAELMRYHPAYARNM